MLQSMLLLLEIILLAATAYIYWMTRRLVSTSNPDLSDPPLTENFGESSSPAKMVRDVTNLLAELQAVANTARNDLVNRHDDLQKILFRAETVTTELRTLLDQVGQASAVPPPRPEEKIAETKATANTPTEISLTLAEALTKFGESLRTDGRSKNTIARTVSHVRSFMTWLGGQRYDTVPLRRIGAVEIEAYLNHLKKEYQNNTAKRKIAAVRAFTNWADIELNKVAEVEQVASTDIKSIPDVAEDTPSKPKSPSQADMLIGANRYQAVFSLAEQGLDQPDIAARTGLEQEAVRMLLQVGTPSHLKH